jgi:hypothetical protein
MAQPCPKHKVALAPGGKRVAVVGYFRAPEYAMDCKERFPLANALRADGCAGHRRPPSRVHYCPRCREELKDWCHEQIAADSGSAKLAACFLKELFEEPPVFVTEPDSNVL